jgi:hypothetical protein
MGTEGVFLMSDIRIAVCHRGWHIVGEYAREGNDIVIRNARPIGEWGTTNGLTELAELGPLPKTQLRQRGTIRLHPLQVIYTIDCNHFKWNDYINGNK